MFKWRRVSIAFLTNENIENVDKIIGQDRRVSIRAIAETLNIDKENRILTFDKNFDQKSRDQICVNMGQFFIVH